MAIVQKCWWVLMPNKAIKGPIQRQAGVGLDPVTLLLGGVRNQNFKQVVTGHTLVWIEWNGTVLADSVGIDQGQTKSVKGSVNKGGVSQCLLPDQVNRFHGIPVMTAIWCQRQHFPLVVAVVVSHFNLCKSTTFICWLPHNWLRLNHPIHFLPFRMGGSYGALVEVVDWWGVWEREPPVEHLDVLSPGHPRQLVSCCCRVLCAQACCIFWCGCSRRYWMIALNLLSTHRVM